MTSRDQLASQEIARMLEQDFNLPVEALPHDVYQDELKEALRQSREPQDDEFDTTSQKVQRAVDLGVQGDGSVDMSGWGLEEISEEIIESIKEATSLDLSDNRLSSLPLSISKLESLRSLDLSGNEIKNLPDQLGQVPLERLDISSNAMTLVPQCISNMGVLKYLDMSGNPIRQFPSLAGSDVLIHLDLSSTSLVEVPEAIFNLKNLTYLNLSSNGLDFMPKKIGELLNLKTLLMSSCNIKVARFSLRKLEKLEILDLSDNQLAAFTPSLPINLKELNLSQNHLSKFPRLSVTSRALQAVDLRANKLQTIPTYLSGMPSRVLLKLDQNNWKEPYRTIIERGVDSLYTYLASLDTSKEMFEAKLLLVGEGEVGKSSLIAALRGDAFLKGRLTTHGIEISRLTVRNKSRPDMPITLNTWDFGGQEVYRITHQFFFSARAIYLIVWKPRIGQEESAIEQWCSRIQLRIRDDATIIIVATHGDERRPEFDYERLRSRFAKVLIGNFVVDNESGLAIKKLAAALGDAASRLPQMGELISQRWIDVREELTRYQQPYMLRLTFERLCSDSGLDEQSTETLANFLHDIGQIIYYGSDEGLRDLIILQPEWLTKAIGFILEDRKTRESGGVVEHSRLASIWGGANESSYPAEFYPYFLRLMEKFDVSYRLPGADASLVAQLVPYERPNFSGTFPINRPRQLRMICRTSDTALGLIAWLTVRNHRYAVGKHWRRGVYLEDAAHLGRAIYELGDDERTIILTVQAPAPQYFFDILRSSLEQLIQDRWPGMKYVLMVPCRNKVHDSETCTGHFTLPALEKFRDRREKKIVCGTCAEWSDVALLLTGFESNNDSLDTVIDRLDLIERMITRVEVSTSENARFIRAALKILGSEVDDCPRLFTMTSSTFRSKIVSKVSLKDSYDLCLWCEEPGEEHPVTDAIYGFKPAKDWLKTVAPYLHTVCRLLQVVLPIAASATEATFGRTISELARADLDATIIMAKAVDSQLAGGGVSSDQENRLSRAEGAGLRALRQLLLTLDPTGRFGGMRKMPTATGDFYWVCPLHYVRYDPGLPSIAGSSSQLVTEIRS